MSPVPVAHSTKGGNTMNVMGMSGKNARGPGGPDLGESMGAALTSDELGFRQHYVQPANDGNIDPNDRTFRDQARTRAAAEGSPLPPYYNQYDGLPVAYAAPSALKERMVLESAVRQAAGKEDIGPNTMRVAPITDTEVAYLKSMKDQSELAKFDDYVETFIDPRQPGNMKWLMEIYPDYVNRRLQQAHTDYEYALRNQMIDSWGINTFDDLHFKYLVDQGKIQGPRLTNRRPALDMNYAPGVLSPFNFQSPNKENSNMALPFASAVHGRRPGRPTDWVVSRANRPLGDGNTEGELAHAMYGNPGYAVPGSIGPFRRRFMGGVSDGGAPVGGRANLGVPA